MVCDGVFAGYGKLKITVWAASQVIFAMAAPFVIIFRVRADRFPTGAADEMLQRGRGFASGIFNEGRKMQVFVHFPEPIRRGRGNIPEALLALAQGFLGPLSQVIPNAGYQEDQPDREGKDSAEDSDGLLENDREAVQRVEMGSDVYQLGEMCISSANRSREKPTMIQFHPLEGMERFCLPSHRRNATRTARMTAIKLSRKMPVMGRIRLATRGIRAPLPSSETGDGRSPEGEERSQNRFRGDFFFCDTGMGQGVRGA